MIQVVLLNITVGDKLIIEQTDELLSEAPEDTDYTPPERIKVKFNLLNYFFFLKNIHFLFFPKKGCCHMGICQGQSHQWPSKGSLDMPDPFQTCKTSNMAWKRGLFCNSVTRGFEPISFDTSIEQMEVTSAF